MLEIKYPERIIILNKLYRSFLRNIKDFLSNFTEIDLSPMQALIIYQIGTKRAQISDIIKLYNGLNPSYTIKQMALRGYLIINENVQDRRMILLSLSRKGESYYQQIYKFFECQEEQLKNLGIDAETWEYLWKLCHKLTLFFQQPPAHSLLDK